MVDPALLALRLLELIALLFPVVGVLLQLQYRATDSDWLERVGLLAGAGLLTLLSMSFVSASGHLQRHRQLQPLASFSLLLLSSVGFLLPAIVLLSSREFFAVAKSVRERTVDGLRSGSSWNPILSLEDESEDENGVDGGED